MSLEPVPVQEDSADCEVALHAAQGEHVASAVTEQAAEMKLPAPHVVHVVQVVATGVVPLTMSVTPVEKVLPVQSLHTMSEVKDAAVA